MYKNVNKNKARSIIWKHSIDTLVNNKQDKTIITDDQVYLYWNYVKELLNKDNILDLENTEEVIKDFLSFKRSYNIKKSVEEIKVLFFCGPEPENDIEELLQLGIRIENIWVIEIDNNTFESALDVIKYAYPSVKIFKTKIENFFEVMQEKFDIVYLDYTATFFSQEQKTFRTTLELFKYNVLNDFGILVTNYSMLNENDDNFEKSLEGLHDYFYHQSAIHELENRDDGRYIEAPYENYVGEFEEIVQNNYKELYSYFLTHFHLYLSEIITPARNIFKNKAVKSIFFDEKNLKEFLKKIDLQKTNNLTLEELFKYGEKELDASSYWFEHFSKNIKDNNRYIYDYISKEKLEISIGLINLLKEVYSAEKFDIVNKKTFNYIRQTQQNLLDPNGGYFCDVPMIHLWYSLVINQLGSPYHINIKNHKRFNYTGNTREMCVDIFTLDKCRYFYDWIPSLYTLPETMMNVGKQIVIRIVIDIIRKQHQEYLLDESFRFGNLLCYDNMDCLKRTILSKRFEIDECSTNEDNKFLEMFEIAYKLAEKVQDNYYKSFASFKKFHQKYTTHAFVFLEIKKIPDNFKVFGKKFKKYNIAENYGFDYYPEGKQLTYKFKRLNGDEKFSLMIHETVNCIFKRYGLECTLINIPD